MKEKANKVDCRGWAGTKERMFLRTTDIAVVYIPLKMREG
jgi:hypothetical protein